MILVVGLGAGGAAQWGWHSLDLAGSSATDLVVANPDHAAGAAGSQRQADPAVIPQSGSSPGAGKGSAPAPAPRASRSAPRTASPSPSTTKPAPESPSPSPTDTKPTSPGSGALPGKPDARSRMEDQAVALTNAERRKQGCDPLRPDARLREAARGHSLDMKKRDFFDHTTPDGVDPWERAKAAGYREPSGENIAKGQQTPADVMKAWMESPGHRENILNCDSKAIGVGVATGPDGPWWTQIFGFGGLEIASRRRARWYYQRARRGGR